jgi:hypothetical protein
MIIHALFAACFAFYMIEVVRWQRSQIFNRKPLNCSPCLSAWSGLATGLIAGYGWHSIEIMFIAGVMGIVINSGIKKFL